MMEEKMKPSGIAWIGDIPNSWNTSKVKYTFEVVNGSTPDSSDFDCWDGDIYWITPADMSETGSITSGERNITRKGYSSCGTSLLPQGSIVISTRAPIGKINLTSTELCTNQGCKSLVKEADNRFFYYLLLAGQDQLVRLGRGTTFVELSTSDLKSFDITIPPRDEQQVIADYLDAQCAKIDSIAADLEKQIELLQKYKKSLITETVTKGVDKSVPIKDSGIAWIGEIPEHWIIQPIKYHVDFYNGDRGENYPSKGEMQSDGVPFINAGHLQNGVLDMENMDYITTEKYRVMGGVKLQPDDILYCLRGSLGKNAIVSIQEGTVASSLVALRATTMVSQYLFYCLNSYTEEIQRNLWDNGTAQPNLSADNLRKFKVCIPPVAEQYEIVQFLASKLKSIDAVIDCKKTQNQMLLQHKQSLIYEYVTGKKRVKEAEQWQSKAAN